jgi:MoxR-like ATPase
MIYNQQKNEFTVKQGPIFANFILADEINRASAKVQSALLQAMQERQITIGDRTFDLEEPFLVLATQNPLEQEGTYPMPEAQVRPVYAEAHHHVSAKGRRETDHPPNISDAPAQVNAVVSPEDILRARNVVREVYMDEKIEQ